MHRIYPAGKSDESDEHAVTYAGRYFSGPVPKHELPDDGMPPRAAYQLVRDELNLDGNPVLNLASFVTTWMEPEADALALEAINKNLIDQDEYPVSEVIHERVVSVLGRLFNASPDCVPMGTATIGSSEAIMLALLAHKRTWRNRRHAAGQPTDCPNMVIGADVHTCWEKFANYFEVEARVAPLSEGSLTLSAADVEARVDENTIAVGGLLGTTFTGGMDELPEINALLAELESTHGWRVPLHIDAASGGFIAPFTDPELAWDFRLSQVRSINVSNHKFGFVYPGMGTVVFRDRSDLPEELVFHINYLGGDMPNYSLNFSRPANTVILQYYNFLRLGRAGYERILTTIMDNTRYLREQLSRLGLEPVGESRIFPIIAVRARDPEALDVFALSDELRKHGWIVPAYTLPPNAEHVAVLRIVVKENLSRELAEHLVEHTRAAIEHLTGRQPAARARPRAPADGRVPHARSQPVR
ncbi:MAG TPA: glutamate decarboxylase [Solirubrobacteraceae bacterium]|nr:glutamate decarboxylase [Solirubrobacteraceae bacterium]